MMLGCSCMLLALPLSALWEGSLAGAFFLLPFSLIGLVLLQAYVGFSLRGGEPLVFSVRGVEIDDPIGDTRARLPWQAIEAIEYSRLPKRLVRIRYTSRSGESGRCLEVPLEMTFWRTSETGLDEETTLGHLDAWVSTRRLGSGETRRGKKGEDLDSGSEAAPAEPEEVLALLA
jgi:hypothetical protein